MRLKRKIPPRKFVVGKKKDIIISDCGEVYLKGNEMVTFVTRSGRHYDVVAKPWGFYATPTLNGRLRNEGFRSALVKNDSGRLHLVLVEKQRVAGFKAYLKKEKNALVEWLDKL